MPDGSPASGCAIVVPSYGRPEKIRECVRHLRALEGGPWRIVVVDDGSPEPIAPLLEGEGAEVIRQSNGGPGTARNAGVRAAEGAELVLFTDDDCRPRPDWAAALVRAQGGVPMRLVGGRVENALEGDVFASASQSLCTYLYDYYQSQGSAMDFFTTNNMCLRRKDFLAVGGFDPSFRIASEDRDLSLRWKNAGGTLAFAQDAVIDHAHDLDLRSFWKQHASYGRGARRLHLAMDAREDPRPKVERAAFYLGLLAHPLRRPGRRRLTQSVLMGLSQVAMVSGYAAALRDERRAGGAEDGRADGRPHGG